MSNLVVTRDYTREDASAAASGAYGEFATLCFVARFLNWRRKLIEET